MSKVLNPNYMEVLVESTDGEYPVQLTLFQEWFEAGVPYVYWATTLVSNFADATSEMSGLTSDIADLANPE